MTFLHSVLLMSRREGKRQKDCTGLEDAKKDLTYLQKEKLQPSRVTSKSSWHTTDWLNRPCFNLYKNTPFIFLAIQTHVFGLEK